MQNFIISPEQPHIYWKFLSMSARLMDVLKLLWVEQTAKVFQLGYLHQRASLTFTATDQGISAPMMLALQRTGSPRQEAPVKLQIQRFRSKLKNHLKVDNSLVKVEPFLLPLLRLRGPRASPRSPQTGSEISKSRPVVTITFISCSTNVTMHSATKSQTTPCFLELLWTVLKISPSSEID